MYLKYFGFQRAPFELVPDPDFLFLGEAHDAALANLVMGLQTGKGFMAISGPVGAGKTTVLRALLRRVRRAERICFLSQPETREADLVRAILDGFGLPSEENAIVDNRRRIRDFLQAGDEPGIVIVDEAHLLSEEAMEQLRLLSNLEEDHRKLVQIVLSGQPELKELLSRPRLRPLAQRIEMYYEIRSLGREETAQYIERRLRIAGGPDEVLFEPAAIDLIQHCSAGVPRLINLIADRALISGYVANTGRITSELVREAYEDLGEVTHAIMPGAPVGFRRGRRDPDSEETKPAAANAGLGARAAVLPLPRRPSRRDRGGRVRSERWLAALGLVAVAVLALFSLGGRHWPPMGGNDIAGAPVAPTVRPPTTEPNAVPPEAGAAELPSRAAVALAPFGVHVASWRTKARAQEMAEELAPRLEIPTRVVPADLQTGRWYRVVLGEFASREEAGGFRRNLEDSGEFPFLRTVVLPPITEVTAASAEVHP